MKPDTDSFHLAAPGSTRTSGDAAPNAPSAHTRGPWRQRMTEVGDRLFPQTVVEVAETGQSVAQALWTKDDTWKANARLIAAAPELLEALQDLLDTGYTGGPQGKRARAALAKATGTQPEAQGWRARDGDGSPARTDDGQMKHKELSNE